MFGGMATPARRTSLHYEWNEESCLGCGSFGKVYKGKHRSTGEVVAVKVCPVEKEEEQLYIAAYLALRTFDSPYIVKYFAYEQVDDCSSMHRKFAIIMELADGSLRRELQEEENIHGLPMAEFMILVDNCISALEYLDMKMVPLRELKPENILIFKKEGAVITKSSLKRYSSPRLVFKICDVGIQRQLSKRNQSRLSILRSPEPMEYSRKTPQHTCGGTTGKPLYPRIRWMQAIKAAAQDQKNETMESLSSPSDGDSFVKNATKGDGLSYTEDDLNMWSTACCFFEAATNRHPFLSNSVSSPARLPAFSGNNPEDMVCLHFDADTGQCVYETEMPEQHSSYTKSFKSILAKYFRLLFGRDKSYLAFKRFSSVTRNMMCIMKDHELYCTNTATVKTYSNPACSERFPRMKMPEKAFEKNFDYTREAIVVASKAGVGAKAAERGFNIRLKTASFVAPNIVWSKTVFPTTLLPAKAGTNVARLVKGANELLLPVVIAIDAANTGISVGKDISRGTTRNTVETTAGVVGGWGGGIGGAAGGAVIGTAIFPGFGALIGGIIGGITGGISGSIAAERVVRVLGDANEYDIAEGEKPCKNCRKKYKYRKYLRQDNGYCDKCQEYA